LSKKDDKKKTLSPLQGEGKQAKDILIAFDGMLQLNIAV